MRWRSMLGESGLRGHAVAKDGDGLAGAACVVEQRDVRSVGAAERDGVDAGRVGVGRSDAHGCGNDVAADVDEKAVLDVVGECAARLIDGDYSAAVGGAHSSADD